MLLVMRQNNDARDSETLEGRRGSVFLIAVFLSGFLVIGSNSEMKCEIAPHITILHTLYFVPRMYRCMSSTFFFPLVIFHMFYMP